MEPRAMWGQVTGMNMFLFRSYWMPYTAFKNLSMGSVQECLLLADTRKKCWIIRLGDELVPRVLEDCQGNILSIEEHMHFVTDAANKLISRVCPEWEWLGTYLIDVERRLYKGMA